MLASADSSFLDKLRVFSLQQEIVTDVLSLCEHRNLTSHCCRLKLREGGDRESRKHWRHQAIWSIKSHVLLRERGTQCVIQMTVLSQLHTHKRYWTDGAILLSLKPNRAKTQKHNVESNLHRRRQNVKFTLCQWFLISTETRLHNCMIDQMYWGCVCECCNNNFLS